MLVSTSQTETLAFPSLHTLISHSDELPVSRLQCLYIRHKLSHITTIAKNASKYVVCLHRVSRYLSPDIILYPYMSTRQP